MILHPNPTQVPDVETVEEEDPVEEESEAEPEANDEGEEEIDFEFEDRPPVFEDETIWNERPRRSEAAIKRQPGYTYTREHMGKRHTGNFTLSEMERLEQSHLLCAQVSANPEMDEEYDSSVAPLIALIMADINHRVTADGVSFAQQHLLHKGLKIFGERGKKGTMKELDQLHKRTCFTPIAISELTPEERRKAVDALMFLSEKRDGTVKGRMVYNGYKTREWHDREDTASPTASYESIILTAMIDSFEDRDVMIADVPNAFIQALLPDND